ncbi:uncharacterized protein LAESUDRAFT_667776 [Laetiporus sulphureus 93-53]|uniref:Uncharacterized protein n=1 Tax=Laetiporus sulphureus 93-53 TaxID=1314785 RepID=A0A165AT70_9APHY|nr:uncharacterized protein LAESUDRAFT_667776 [Laetiporus sulphureus 93-53]KZS99616.1 hypothetical protein LAESUDRAFT_667776 [Laetiporus sulphureus 93-53]
MGKSEIESWTASTSSAVDDTNSVNNGTASTQLEWRREDVLADWSRALEAARCRLLTSSTKSRVQFLREELMVSLPDLDISQAMDIFRLLTLTYPRYADPQPREAVEELIQRDELRGIPGGGPDVPKLGVAEQILRWLSQEVGHISKRSRFVLV